MEQITIRPATLDDLPILLTFEQGIVTAERPFDPTLKPEGVSYYDLGDFIKADDVEVAVAVLGDELIGSGYARIKEHARPNFTPHRYAFLGFMYVKPEHRGKGVIQMILDYLKGWAKSQGLTEMRLQVYDENESAVKAYEKKGFSKLLTEMRVDMD